MDRDGWDAGDLEKGVDDGQDGCRPEGRWTLRIVMIPGSWTLPATPALPVNTAFKRLEGTMGLEDVDSLPQYLRSLPYPISKKVFLLQSATHCMDMT